jgi:hypothetical protein
MALTWAVRLPVIGSKQKLLASHNLRLCVGACLSHCGILQQVGRTTVCACFWSCHLAIFPLLEYHNRIFKGKDALGLQVTLGCRGHCNLPLPELDLHGSTCHVLAEFAFNRAQIIYDSCCEHRTLRNPMAGWTLRRRDVERRE